MSGSVGASEGNDRGDLTPGTRPDGESAKIVSRQPGVANGSTRSAKGMPA
jgi:hypothetical protein